MVDPVEADRERDAAVGRRDGSAVGRDAAGAGGEPGRSCAAASGSRPAGRDLDVAYTPGHASHHVSYFSADTGIAFVGDTAGVRLQAGRFIMPPTPPPDIDLEAWRDSLARIGAWQPEHAVHHALRPVRAGGGAPHRDGGSSRADERPGEGVAGARRAPTTSAEAWFADEIRRELRRRMSEADAQAYEVAGRFDLNWRGLARYWRKRVGIERSRSERASNRSDRSSLRGRARLFRRPRPRRGSTIRRSARPCGCDADGGDTR